MAPYVALNFQCYEGLKFLLIPEGSDKPSSTRKLICGALAGSIAQTITYPLGKKKEQTAEFLLSLQVYQYVDKILH